MAFLIAGAVVFAVGSLFGVLLVMTGQQMQQKKTSQRLQDALLKGMEKKVSDCENRCFGKEQN